MYRVITRDIETIEKTLEEITVWKSKYTDEPTPKTLFGMEPSESKIAQEVVNRALLISNVGAVELRDILTIAMGEDSALNIFYRIIIEFRPSSTDFMNQRKETIALLEEIVEELEWALVRGDLN